MRTLVLIVLAAVAGAVANQYLPGLLDRLNPRETVAEKLADVQETAARRGLRPGVRRVQLQATGERSYVVHLRFVAYAPGANVNRQRSDEVRIYDPLSETELRSWAFSPAGDLSRLINTSAWRFVLLGTPDLADDGRHELIGYFTENRADSPDARPVIIEWDPRLRRYRVSAPLRRPIGLRKMANLDYRDRLERAQYLTPARLTDPARQIRLTSYGTGVVALTGSKPLPLLLTGSTAGFPQIQIDAYAIDASSVPARVTHCGRAFVRTSQSRGVDESELRRLWTSSGRQSRC